MKKQVFLFLSILFLFAACNSTKNVQQNRWMPPAIKVDGQLSEWDLPLYQPVSHTRIECEAANDREFLYLGIRIPDKGIQRKIMTLGMTIWLDTLMKSKEKIGIGYPLALTEPQLEQIAIASTTNGQLDDRKLDGEYAKICQEFELVGLAKEKIRVSNLASKDIKAITAFDDVGAMVCELKLPLSHLWEGSIAYNEKLSVGIKVNPPEVDATDDPSLFDERNNNNTRMGNNRTNPMNNGLPGQQGQTSRFPNNPDRNISVWLRTTLTKSKDN